MYKRDFYAEKKSHTPTQSLIKSNNDYKNLNKNTK